MIDWNKFEEGDDTVWFDEDGKCYARGDSVASRLPDLDSVDNAGKAFTRQSQAEAKEIDWSLVPDWAEYVAMDSSGETYGFNYRPHEENEGGYWIALGGYKQIPELDNYIDRREWRSSLVRRPVECAANPNTRSLTDLQAREIAKKTGLCRDGFKCGLRPASFCDDGQYCDDCPNAPHAQDAPPLNSQLRDAINPGHYRQGGIECIDAIKAATVGKTGIDAACVANVIKYLWRYEEKNGVEDVRKAIWYIKRLESELSE